jgi:hypothetical protein
MSGPTWEQIIDAVIVGDARIGPYIARAIVKADNRAETPLAAIIVEIPANIASNRAGVESEVEAAIIETNTDDDWDVTRAGDPDWEGDVYEPRGLYDQDEWGDPVVDYDDDDDIADVPTPSPTDGGDGLSLSAIENDTDDSQELVSVSSEIEALSVIASTDDADGGIVSDSTSPKADREGGDTVHFDRPSRPPGLTKLQHRVWDWIEANADGRAAKNLSATIVHNATGNARGVCGKLLTQYRGWTDSMERTA